MTNQTEADIPETVEEGAMASSDRRTGDAEKAMVVKPEGQKPRHYYVDWIRSLAIHLVVYIHCLNVAQERRLLPLNIRNDIFAFVNYEPGFRADDQYIRGIQRTLVQIGIPILFYISGFSTTFYSTEDKGFCRFLKQRFMRLILPFIFAILVLMVPRLYVAQDFSFWVRHDGKTIEWNFLTFYAKIMPQFLTKMSWLWFLPALFIISVINYPLLKLSQRRKAGKDFRLFQDGLAFLMLFITLAGWSVVCIFVAEEDKGVNNLVPSIGLLFFSQILFSLAPFFLLKKVQGGEKYALVLKLIGPLTHCLMNVFKDGNMPYLWYGFFTTITYDIVFTAQGIIDQIFSEEIEAARRGVAETAAMPLAFVGFFLMYSLTCPTANDSAGYTFFYPLYDATWHQCFFVLGSWMWLNLIMFNGQRHLNSRFSEAIYNLLVGSSLYVYLTHYLFLALVAWVLVVRTDMGFIANFFLLFVLSEGVTLLSYLAVSKLQAKLRARFGTS